MQISGIWGKYGVTRNDGRKIRVNYLETAFLFYLLSLIFIANESVKCAFDSKAPLHVLSRSLRPRNYTALARRLHEWTRSENLTFIASAEVLRTLRLRIRFLRDMTLRQLIIDSRRFEGM